MKKRKMEKKLNLLHLLGVARPLSPPLLHESQWSFFSSLSSIMMAMVRKKEVVMAIASKREEGGGRKSGRRGRV